jgi:hypothetical protein
MLARQLLDWRKLAMGRTHIYLPAIMAVAIAVMTITGMRIESARGISAILQTWITWTATKR